MAERWFRRIGRIKEATQTYRDNQDLLHDFLAEKCFIEISETVTVADLYKAYLSWCDSNGDKHFLGKGKFNTRIGEKGFVKKAGTGNKTVWHGLRLLTDAEIVNLVKTVNEKTVSSSIRENDEKLPQNTPSNLTKQSTLKLNTPKVVKSLDENCPDCGGINLVCWPNDPTIYYCEDCYPGGVPAPDF